MLNTSHICYTFQNMMRELVLLMVYKIKSLRRCGSTFWTQVRTQLVSFAAPASPESIRTRTSIGIVVIRIAGHRRLPRDVADVGAAGEYEQCSPVRMNHRDRKDLRSRAARRGPARQHPQHSIDLGHRAQRQANVAGNA